MKLILAPQSRPPYQAHLLASILAVCAKSILKQIDFVSAEGPFQAVSTSSAVASINLVAEVELVQRTYPELLAPTHLAAEAELAQRSSEMGVLADVALAHWATMRTTWSVAAATRTAA